VSHPQLANPVMGAPAVDMMGLLSRCLGNFKMVERVLSTFRTTGCSDIEQLSSAIECADFAAATDIAHRLRGAAGNVSATRLRDLLKDAERLAGEQNRDELLMMLGRLHAEWEEFERLSETLIPASRAPSSGSNRKLQSPLETCHAGTSC
jgi:HPt (histidine-containing phosphotransfer) domain-containing protein